MAEKQTATKKVLELIGNSLLQKKKYSLESEQLKELFDDFGDEILYPMKSKYGEKYIQKLSKEHNDFETFRDYLINSFVSLVAQKSFNEYGIFEGPEGVELILTLAKTDEEVLIKEFSEYVLDTYDLETQREISEHGCDSGRAEYHAYPEETVPLYDKYEEEMTNYIDKKCGEKALAEVFDHNKGRLNSYKNDVVWMSIELISQANLEKVDQEEEED